MLNKNLVEIGLSKLPKRIIQDLEIGKGKIFNFVSGAVVIDILNRAFDFCWSFEVEKEWIERGRDKIIKYRDGKRLTTPEYEPQGDIAFVKGVLKVPVYNPLNKEVTWISRYAFGSESIKKEAGQDQQEHYFKAAATDALKKAASTLGICGELYRKKNKGEQDFFVSLFEEPDPDEWTEEDLNVYAKEIQYIQDLNMTEDETMTMIKQATNGKYDNIVPDNIVEVVHAIKSMIKTETAGA